MRRRARRQVQWYRPTILTFIALKPGLLTGKARDVVGQLHHHALGLERWLTGQSTPLTRFCAAHLADWLPPRRATSHKGDHGKLVIVGGDRGTAGAIRMCGEAALLQRRGTGASAYHPENVAPIVTVRPELMVDEPTPQTPENPRWSGRTWWRLALAWGSANGDAAPCARWKVLTNRWSGDADALNLLAFNPDKRHNRVLTPHPGEAARLLNVSVAEIESDRLLSAQRLVKRYGGVVVLKGAGTVVASESGAMGIIDAGNAGMASGGMGDVLTGIIAALLGQHLTPHDAACAGCVAHGDAADRLAAREGTRGMLATDLFSTLRRVVNRM